MQFSVRRRVKIVCTLGPASSTSTKIEALIRQGLDVARLNFSHGTHDFHRGLIQEVRAASARIGKTVAIMQDLQGPKLRCGKLVDGGLNLKAGDCLLLHAEGTSPAGSLSGRIPLPISKDAAEAFRSGVQVGARVLFDDGKLSARVSEVLASDVVIEIELGGNLSSNKGINLPGASLAIPCLTEKDLRDLKFGLDQNVDAVALSFVRSPDDILRLKHEMKQITTRIPIVIPKIELDEAVIRKDEIIEVSDGLLIARGDMAVELGAERVPVIQKELIRSCNRMGVPVITATQMLESMISAPTPTRAEASDVANAVFDGTDAVMLSGETANGQYPEETVGTMARIVLEAERFMRESPRATDTRSPVMGSVVDAIEFSAARMSEQVDAVAIACLTHSGMAARTLARYRPDRPIIAILDNERMMKRLCFVWGVQTVQIPEIVGTDDLFAMVESVLLPGGHAQLGDLVVVTAGLPTLRRGTTNMVKVHRMGARSERVTI